MLNRIKLKLHEIKLKISSLPFSLKASKMFTFVQKTEYEKDVFEDWQNGDKMFVPTKASKELRKMITFKRLVIVAGKI